MYENKNANNFSTKPEIYQFYFNNLKLQAPKSVKIDPEPVPITQTLKRKMPQKMAMNSPPKRFMSSSQVENDICIEDMVVEFADESNITESIYPPPPMKILNKQTTIKSIEPVLRAPILKTNEDGKVEVVSEILEQELTDFDPIKDAAPVETNVFPCNYCERSFPLRQLLDIHVANHVRDRKFQCNICNKGFFSKYDLGKHELIHTGEKPFKCVVCGKAFSRSTLLRRHEKIHSDQPKFLCAYCERPFLSKDEWEKHTQNHQKKRPFNCDICGKSFAFKQGLERHEVVHSTDQPYKCEHCDQGFSTQGKLARHLTAHAGDRPYPCRICDKSYLLSHHLTRHMRSHKESNSQTIHKCAECDMSFPKRDELTAHLAVHATESMACPLCKTTFEDVDDITEHIKQHTEGEQFACEFCDLIFSTESELHEHCDTQHLEEIELYEQDGLAESFADADGDEDDVDEIVKPEVDEFVEYTEHVEVISPDEEVLEDEEPPKIKPNNRSYGNAKKQTEAIKPQRGAEKKAAAKPTEKPANASNAESKSKVLNYGKAALNSNRSPNTRASSVSTKTEIAADKLLVSNNTRSNKPSPTKVPPGSSKAVPTSDAGKKSASQTSLTKFLTIKPKSNESGADAKALTLKKVVPLPTLKSAGKDETSKTTEIKVANKMVKVKHIRMTKSQIEALTKEGKIELRDGQVIFKNKNSPKKK